MPSWLIGKLLAPFVAMLLLWLVLAPIRRKLQRSMPEGRLKRLLLRRI